MTTPRAIDMLIQTDNPEALDRTVNHFGAAVVGMGVPGGPKKVDDCFVVRCFADPGFIAFAIENQGYGKVVKTFNGLYHEEEQDEPKTSI